VRNWNAGKREEYGQRLSFALPAGALPRAKGAAEGSAATKAATQAAVAPAPRPAPASAPAAALPGAASLRDGVLVFTRAACPNCPPVKNYVVESGMKAIFVDVDEAEGLELARERGILATPTVLGLDAEGREAFRAFDVASLRTQIAEVAL
jgi:hypothetical protein